MSGILITTNDERAEARLEETQSRIARRAYQLFQAEGSRPGRALADWLEAEREISRPVPAEILEAEDGALIVRAEVPGFQLGDLELDLGPDRAVLFGNCHEPNGRGRILLDERGGPSICKRIPLPLGVDTREVKTRLQRGVLDIHIAPARKRPH